MFHQPRQQTVSQHQFAMVPRNDIPRSAWRVRTSHKTTFDSGTLIPIFVEEVLPGDSFHMSMTAFARMATLIFPLMDNIYMDTFFFFVPNRLVWDNWQKFMGEQANPGDSISFLIPTQSPAIGNGYLPGSVEAYMGLPVSTQITGTTYPHSALPLRAYSLIYNEWFRDENIGSSVTVPTGDGPDGAIAGGRAPLRRNKRHDYFTSCLPFPAKSAAVNMPLSGLAPIQGLGWTGTFGGPSAGAINAIETARGGLGGVSYPNYYRIEKTPVVVPDATFVVQSQGGAIGAQPAVYADLSQATNATIEALRQAFQIQRLLEKDARGGTRYTEILRSHFGVVSPDARLQRPEYLGGSTSAININPVAQTSVTAATPQGNLSGVGTGVHQSGFSQSFVEHGHIIGLVSVRAELTYQQGLRRMWSRSTRYDFYWPSFSHLGEQAVLQKEIYTIGTAGAADDDKVFGYQERYAEYRYHPSMITGKFKSGVAGTIDTWHLAQQFTAAPSLNPNFLREDPPISRVIAAGAAADGMQFLFDSVFDIRMVRPMPMYSVPGFVDHF